MNIFPFFAHFLLCIISMPNVSKGEKNCVSAVGDPGMRRDGLKVAIEGWNFCNEVGNEAPSMGSPRAADCFDVHPSRKHKHKRKQQVPLF
ncbi:hypothetical protein Leryth_005591 [Lithospermum erythrorhizon]|nr:hypothetical protein Leryth_005591 [Lithospermum erythrorhizon]